MFGFEPCELFNNEKPKVEEVNPSKIEFAVVTDINTF